MRKFISAIISLCLLSGIFPIECQAKEKLVTPELINVNVNGEDTSVLSAKIKKVQYMSLRDLAHSANGSDRQFNISVNKEKTTINIYSNTPYKPEGNEATLRDNKPQKAVAFKGKWIFHYISRNACDAKYR